MEYFRFKVWKSMLKHEIPVALSYEKGINNYTPDKLAIVEAFHKLDSFSIDIQEMIWDLISSPIVPFYPFLDSLFTPDIIIRDEKNIIFYPVESIEEEYLWNYLNGYKINSNSEDNVMFFGSVLSIDDFSMNIPKNTWKYIPVLSMDSISVNTIFPELSNDIKVIKDIYGKLLIPEYNISEIKYFYSGKAYQIISSENIELEYDAEASDNNHFSVLNDECEHFVLDYYNTGSNMTLIIEPDEIAIGDELAVLSQDNRIAGIAKANDGNFFVSVWGDDTFTNDIIDGANPNESLHFKIWKKAENNEYDFNIHELDNYVTGQKLSRELKYSKDAIYLIKASREILGTNDNNKKVLLNIFPNPVISSAYISFSVKESSLVKINLISAIGYRYELYSDCRIPGHYTINFNSKRFASGVYLLELINNNVIIYKKIILH